MDLEKIRELVKIMEESSLSELTVKEEALEVSLKKQVEATLVATEVVHKSVAEELDEVCEEDEEDAYIMSPMVGTYYSAASPDAASYVNVGDVVSTGQTLCIIEAMKLMNEIECEFDAEIVSVMVSNEQKVEYGQPLFKVKRI